jgi:uncharacterized hydrophobic protein (TIGR00341 family)
MKQLQITIPNEPQERINSVLTILKQDLGIKNMIWLKGDNNSLIMFRCQSNAVSKLLYDLSKIGIGTTYGIIDIVNLTATIPEASAVEGDEDLLTERISIEEIKKNLIQSTSNWVHYVIFIILAALTAGGGLILSSPAIVIASMIISPLMAPILSFSFGIMIKDKRLVASGSIGQIIGIILGIGIGLFMGRVVYLADNTPEPTYEMVVRTQVGPAEIVIAVCAGLAVGFCITNSIESSLVGVAIAASLMPPAVNVGICLGYGQPALAWGSFLLLLMNVILINVGALLVFRIKQIRKHFLPEQLWEGIQEEKPKTKQVRGRRGKKIG